MKINCAECGEEFERADKYVTRAKKKGWAPCCTKQCSGSYAMRQRFGEDYGFGYYNKNCENRSRKKGWDYALNTTYFRKLFNSQDGKCAITGIPMTMNSTIAEKSPFCASVDRLDGSKGYVEGNVQFVCLGVNYMRNTFSVEQITEFLDRLRLSRHNGHRMDTPAL